MLHIKYSQQGDMSYNNSHQFETIGHFDAPKKPKAVSTHLKIKWMLISHTGFLCCTSKS